ncbi:GNAT family N-acetyltransferase [Gilvimarinus sp. SDUM040013]|uniref:GNAT family N-acetyltransferase n=1 Tax=Gilvimarinus gilvus TaxID=3058038 RepID=A0ABU4RTE3_9GAMM|nr:GNAT family N-acetyltransferase [Gilvimarinus sp. SDUM040013]MDO3386951.1 GNAT family N-acetyltransferase [Gilvimarinus sp. SDUM040013]MDX6848155.1 GNAT family N-acetyltransferase [Gilvimarinus sp. SDUM040013]
MQFVKQPVDAYPAITKQYRRWGERAKCGKRDLVYTLADAKGQWIAAARLLPVEGDTYLLRNLTVAPSLRRQGIARLLMQRIVTDDSIQSLYCYALEYLEAFYLSVGFATKTPEQVPSAIAQPYQRYRANGKSFVLMGFELPRGLTGV